MNQDVETTTFVFTVYQERTLIEKCWELAEAKSSDADPVGAVFDAFKSELADLGFEIRLWPIRPD